MKPTGHKRRLSFVIIIGIACTTLGYIYLVKTDNGEQKQKDPAISEQSFNEPEKLTDEKCIPICDTKECTSLATILLKRMDSNVNPCDNFDSFLCGGFKKKFGSDDHSFAADIMLEARSNALKDILNNIQADPGGASAKLKTAYDSCRSASAEIKGVETFQSFLNELGILKWPKLAPDFQFTDTNFASILGKLMVYFDFFFFFEHTLIGNLGDEIPSSYIKVHFLLDSDDIIINISEEVLADVLNYFDLNKDEVDMLWRDLITFRNSVSKIKEEKCEEDCGNEKKIECSQHTDDDWAYFCQFMNSYIDNSGARKYLESDDFSIMFDRHRKINQFFLLMKELPDRILANVISLGVLLKNMGEINFYFRLMKMKHLVNIGEFLQFEMDKEKYCVGWVAKNLHTALLTEFIDQYLTLTAISEIIELQEEYRTTLADLVALQNWIPSYEKSYMENKVRDIEINFIIFNLLQANRASFKASLNAFIEKLNLTQGEFFRNALQIYKRKRNNFELMNENNMVFLFASDLIKFDVSVSYPSPIANKEAINLGLGMLFPPFFIPGLNKNLKRVQFPELFGHEMGHYLRQAFASAAEGNENSRKFYLEKKLCLEKQFSEFKLDLINKSLNGNQYIGENIADNIGASLLDKTTEKYNSSELEVLLPGVPHSTAQLLFMVANQFFCSKENLETERRYAVYDHHAPLEFRMIGMMQNSRKFSEAFQCDNGTYMNPSSKCSLLDYS